MLHVIIKVFGISRSFMCFLKTHNDIIINSGLVIGIKRPTLACESFKPQNWLTLPTFEVEGQ